jgi:hypothetical protein
LVSANTPKIILDSLVTRGGNAVRTNNVHNDIKYYIFYSFTQYVCGSRTMTQQHILYHEGGELVHDEQPVNVGLFFLEECQLCQGLHSSGGQVPQFQTVTYIVQNFCDI